MSVGNLFMYISSIFKVSHQVFISLYHCISVYFLYSYSITLVESIGLNCQWKRIIIATNLNSFVGTVL